MRLAIAVAVVAGSVTLQGQGQPQNSLRPAAAPPAVSVQPEAAAARMEADAASFEKSIAESQRNLESSLRNLALQQRIDSLRGPGAPALKALVIRSSGMEGSEHANLQEDLEVMSRILEKATASIADGNQPRRAMGINVAFGPGQNPIRAAYLEGYGAVFTLAVGFPLLPPPGGTASRGEQPESNSTWEQTRRELRAPYDPYFIQTEMELIRSRAKQGEPYNEGRVELLKDELLAALKNAANIRHLKPADSVTICVLGGGARSSGRTQGVIDPFTGHPAAGVWMDHDSAGNGTILTMRATKADVDAFNAAKLTAAEFGKKISISVYEMNGGSAGRSASAGSAHGITGYEHVVQAGETLSSILHACAARGVSVTLDDVLKANPGLRPERLRVGQKIFIPES